MRPLALFYALVIYIFLQFGWWTWLLLDLNHEVYRQKQELSLLQDMPSSSPEIYQQKIRQRTWMVAGEGAVFLIILALGFIQIRKGFKKEMELASRQKNFLLSVTHEFKSPLAAIKLYLETILKRDLDKEKHKEFITNAIGDTERLNLLVEKALMAAKLESRENSFVKEKINASDALETMLASHAAMINPSISVRKNIQQNISILIDRTAFASLFLNLFENAAKYAPEGSVVTVTFASKGNEAVLSVADEGPGVRDEEKEKIFEKFYRSGNEETRRTKGTGLGLYIAKQIADAHGASITVKKNSPKGTIFEVLLSVS